MSERVIQISPYKTYDDLIKLSGKVIIPDSNIEIDIPETRSLNLYNYELTETLTIIPRNYDTLEVKINLAWKKDFHLSSFSNILGPNENPTEVLGFRLQITCDKTRWCSEQKRIDISSITKRATFSFEIPLSDVKGILQIEGFIVREIEIKNAEFHIPDAQLAIVSTSKELSIQVDEIREIGGEYLPIGPGNTGDLAFNIMGLENPFELPKIYYSEDLKPYLTRDDIISVSTSILTGLFYFLDQYLKWFVFVCRLDINNKYHNSLVELFSRYCLVSKDDIIDVVESDKFSQEQTKAYLNLSTKLFNGLQIQNKYKKELRMLYKSEIK